RAKRQRSRISFEIRYSPFCPTKKRPRRSGDTPCKALAEYTPARPLSSAASLISVPKIWIVSGGPSLRDSRTAVATEKTPLPRAAGHPDADRLFRRTAFTEDGKDVLT